MKTLLSRPALSLILIFSTSAHVQAEDTLSAFAGLQMVSQRFGGNSVEHVVEMSGQLGQAQPESWNLTVHDPSSPWLIRKFAITGQQTKDEGGSAEFYPDRLPAGYIHRTNLQVDSTAAFRILDELAREVGVGFNSIDYLLRCREYSEEPVWQLTAVDVEGVKVGRVDISGATGEVLRTVWYAWEPGIRAPRIADSAIAVGMPLAGAPQNVPLREEASREPSRTLREPYLPPADPTLAPPAVTPGPPANTRLRPADPSRPPVAEVSPADPVLPPSISGPPVESTPMLPPPPRVEVEPAIPGPQMPPGRLPASQPGIPSPGRVDPAVPGSVPSGGLTPFVPPPPVIPDGIPGPGVPQGSRVIDDPNSDPVIVEPIPPEP